MSQRNSPPLEAAILPDARPRKSWVPFIMGSILVGSCLLAVVIGVWGLVKLVESLDRPGTFAGVSGSDTWQSTGDKQAEYRASFKVPVDAPQGADVPQVEKVLKKYVTASTTNDVGGLARLVDVNAFLERMEDHPDMPRFDSAGRRTLLDLLNKNLQLPAGVVDFRLMAVHRQPRDGQVVADVILKSTDGIFEPRRLWLVEKERAWSVVDWELVEEGKSEAGKWASAQRLEQDYERLSYDAGMDELEKADERYYQGDIPGAVKLVQTANQRSVPGYIHKESQWAVASRFYQYGQFQHAIDCLDTVRDPAELPGVYVIFALCHQALGQGEKAIAAAAAYEQLCGFSPDVVRAKALALAQLGKKDEAIIELRRLLEFDTRDHVALQNLVRLLPEGQKGQVADIIARSQDPPKTALAISYWILEDDETAQVVQSLLEKQHGRSATTHAFVAQLHLHNEDFELAAAAFRQAHAAQADAGIKEQHWNQYLSAMHSAGKVVPAYEESPDAVKAFAYLTEGLEEGAVVAIDDLPPLLEAHRHRAPGDPRLDYCAGHWALQQGDLAAAAEAFAAGEAAATDEVLKVSLQFARLGVLADQGRILDAYRDYENLPGAFAELARRSIEQKKPNVLEELLRNHRKSQPSDWELKYYTIALDIERGKFQQALASIRKERGAVDPDEQLVPHLNWLQVDAYLRDAHWEQSILQQPPPAEIWPLLAARLEEEEDWPRLRKLLAMPPFRESASARWTVHAMKLAWNLQDYAQIESLVPRWEASLWKDVPPHEQNWAQETLVRSLLRQGKITAAYGFAEQFQREFQQEFPLLLVRLAQGNTENVQGILQRERYALELDTELLPLLTDPRFSQLRRESPLDLPAANPRTSLLLFLRKDVALTEERLRQLLPGDESFSVKLLADTSRPGQTLAVTHDSGFIFLTSHQAPYRLLPEDWSRIRASFEPAGASGQATASDLQLHTAWLAIELWDSPASPPGPREDRLAKKLVQALIGDNLLALAHNSSYTDRTLMRGTLLTADSLTPERTWKELFTGGIRVWLTQRPVEALEKRPLDGRKAQREFTAAMAGLSAGEWAQVRVEITLGHVAEEVWLKVLRTQRDDYQVRHLICELPTDSQLYPSWKAGEHCSVSFWQVLETRLPEAK